MAVEPPMAPTNQSSVVGATVAFTCRQFHGPIHVGIKVGDCAQELRLRGATSGEVSLTKATLRIRADDRVAAAARRLA